VGDRGAVAAVLMCGSRPLGLGLGVSPHTLYNLCVPCRWILIGPTMLAQRCPGMSPEGTGRWRNCCIKLAASV
jgi:hypothetical protein